ncbi:MAG: hypothetical protein L3J53_08095 [Proteobacteria bacterium]|nr:hypothetical protein [Pseudomonadota bacterium]
MISPEDSDYTSIQERIIQSQTSLKPFGNKQQEINYSISNYILLVECTGRTIVAESKGCIPDDLPDDLPDILVRLGLNPDIWLDEIKYFDKWYFKAIGTIDNMKKYCQSIKQKYIKGLPKDSYIKLASVN